MNAPLSLFLTRFSAAPSLRVVEPTSVTPKTTLILTDEELDARLKAAAAEARSDGELRLKEEIDALTATHAAALDDALTTARAEWVKAEAESLSAGLEQAMAELHEMLADRLAAVLRPFVTDTLVNRTKRELRDAVGRLLTDPTQLTLAVRGPDDLIAALRANCPSTSIAWTVSESCEVAITADATRVETCLSAALADLASSEP